MTSRGYSAPPVDSFRYASNYLGDRDHRRLAYQTKLVRRGDHEIAIVHYATDIVTFTRHGQIVLNTGGHDTSTTTVRMDYHTPANVRVNLSKGRTYVTVDNGEALELNPRLTIDPGLVTQ